MLEVSGTSLLKYCIKTGVVMKMHKRYELLYTSNSKDRICRS